MGAEEMAQQVTEFAAQAYGIEFESPAPMWKQSVAGNADKGKRHSDHGTMAI